MSFFLKKLDFRNLAQPSYDGRAIRSDFISTSALLADLDLSFVGLTLIGVGLVITAADRV